MPSMHPQQLFIQPNLTQYSSIKELLEHKNDFETAFFASESNITFDEIFRLKNTFIVAEPGYGKTRLLKEILLQAKAKKAFFLELKKIINSDITSFISEKLCIAKNIKDITSEKELQREAFLKTKGFKLKNDKETIICLDALDEVSQQDFSNVVDRIKEFTKQYPDVSLFVSCRWHHFNKYKYLFLDYEFSYVQVKRFSYDQTQEYLEKSGIPKDNIAKIFDFFEYKENGLLIQVPRYLQMLTKLAESKGVDFLKNTKKTDIFEHFIYKKLEIEGGKINHQQQEILKRVLEKLALIMKIYQTNLITKEELMTFFDDVKSDLKISLLQQVPIEIFYDRSLLKDNIYTIEFENVEFQEYLAAKELLRLGKTDQIVFDIAMDQELREIFPSWFNTLGFVVDLDISLLKPILFFEASKNAIVKDEEYHRLLTKVDPNRLSIDEKKEIFEKVFTYYQKILHWIGIDIAENLSLYFDISQNGLLKESIDGKGIKGTTSFVRKGNVAYVLEFLIAKNIFDQREREYWKNKLLEFAKDKNENGVLQRHTLSALKEFKDIKLIQQVSHLFNHHDELIVREFLTACLEVNPNDPFSIQCFVESTKRNKITARYQLQRVNEKKGIQILLDYFLKDQIFLSQYIGEGRSYRDTDNKLIQNIRYVLDSEIETKLKDIISAAFSNKDLYSAENSEFIKNLALLLKEKNRDYIFYLTSEIKKSNKLRDRLYYFEKIFAALLEKKQVKKFVKQLKELKDGGWYAFRVLQEIKFSQRESAELIYEEGRKYFKEEYKRAEKSWDKQSKEDSLEKGIYRKFQIKLKPTKGMYDLGVFKFYLQNKEQISQFINDTEIKRLKKLVIGSVFEKFDPGDQELTITDKNGGSRSYRTHNFIHIFGHCLEIAKELKINISKYRQKIINYIPFAYSEHLSTIFSLVPDPQSSEINKLVDVYNSARKDDLAEFMPGSFIQASEQYLLLEAIPVLEKFVCETEFSLYERRDSLKAIATIKPDKSYFQKIFKKNNPGETAPLAEDANEYLIEKFSDNVAIKWRFDQLKKRAFPFMEPTGAHSVGSLESELQDMRFASPIMHLKDPKFKEIFLDLLGSSFKIIKKDNKHWSYTSYLWRIVIAYFTNLKEHKSYSHLKDLEYKVKELSSQEGINWFKGRLQELKREYMNYIGKPQSIAECIKKYNRFKENQYLEISSSRDLFEIVKKTINEDIKKWVESEGAYKLIKELTGKQEDLIQKTMQTQLENSLLRRGFRPNEINIRREEQLLDDKRTDFLISYGFIGPIMIEIKRVDNKEITSDSKRLKYRKKLLQYIEGTKSDFGIFLIFQISEEYSLKKYIPKIEEIYKDYPNIEIMELNCLKN